MAATPNPSLKTAEAVQSHSKLLRKELGMTDLALAQILIVIVPEFFGTAVKAGPSHVVLWLLAILLFFVPQALVVAHLNRLMPLEGGLYQWAKLGGGELVGFLVGWNLWVYAIVIMSSLGLELMTMLSYAFGPKGA